MRSSRLIPLLCKSWARRCFASSGVTEGHHRFIDLVNSIRRNPRNYLAPNLKSMNDFPVGDIGYDNKSILSLASTICLTYIMLPPSSSYIERTLSTNYDSSSSYHDDHETEKPRLMTGLDLDNRFDNLRYLVLECGPNIDAVLSLLHSFHDHHDRNREFMEKLRVSCTPEYLRIFKIVLSKADHGLALPFLIQLREDAREKIKYLESHTSRIDVGHAEETNRLKVLDEDLKELLSNLFQKRCLGKKCYI